MATAIATLITQVRRHMSAETDTYWSDDELAYLINLGVKDLWRGINDLFQEYFVTVDDTHFTLAATTSSISGVQADVFRIVSIEPRVVGETNPTPGVIFKPRKYNHPDFQRARAIGPVEPRGVVIFYDVVNAGAPVGAPTLLVAPQITAAMDLRVVYNQTLTDVGKADSNPIPGESDNALIAWCVAYARAKEREDSGLRSPDAEWIAVYGTEKKNLLIQLTPRSIQEPEVVEGFFEELWQGWS